MYQCMFVLRNLLMVEKVLLITNDLAAFFTARCMCIGRHFYSKSSVYLSFCNVEIPRLYELGYFENNYTNN